MHFLAFILPYVVIAIVMYIVMSALLNFIWGIAGTLLDIVNYFNKQQK